MDKQSTLDSVLSLMTLPKVNIVWLKRDLRLNDHAPLQKAVSAGIPVVVLYILDTTVVAESHYAHRHWQFVRDCLVDLGNVLKSHNQSLTVFQGESIEVFDELNTHYDIQGVYSHQETGLNVTYEIDKSFAKWCILNNVEWCEDQTNGVLRGISNRTDWVKKWYAYMHDDQVVLDIKSLDTVKPVLPQYECTYFKNLEIDAEIQRGGEQRAHALLSSFVSDRSKRYMYHISKPAESRESCSRLSPHLAWGSVSIRQVYQATYVAKKDGNKRNLNGFLSRLRWHDHFIQKFEQEVEMEFIPQNKAYSYIKRERNQEYITRWETGATGIPLIDACMRCVIKTGYLNFRMRSMLVSFLTHALLQGWENGVHFLARQFTDFEPGIHYPQFQMQASVTGINTIRIYNPTKQAQEHDPHGLFIKKWVSELADFPKEYIHEPWKMNEMERVMFGVKTDYPGPIIDVTEALKVARVELWGDKKSKSVRAGRKEVLDKHTIKGRKNQ
jgi:deoxyribodipyrimidine photo-lyase